MSTISTVKKRVLLTEIGVFGLIEALLWIDNLWGGILVNAAQYACVVLCFVFSLLFFGRFPKRFLIQVGLLMTCVADFFLVVSNPAEKDAAMTAFVLTQIAYCAVIVMFGGKIFNVVHLSVRAAASVAVEITAAVVLKDKFDYLAAVSMFYYINLIINAVCAFVLFKKLPLFAIGLFLFILCDTLIGLNVAVGAYIAVDETSFIYAISHSSFNWAWAFYLPSQALIAVFAATTSNKLPDNQ